MSMTSFLAVDFGTVRTKVAYLPAGGQRPELVRFGQAGLPYLPSLVWVPRPDGALAFGEEATERVDEDPAGVVDVPKRRLRDRVIRVQGRSLAPMTIVRDLLFFLRRYAADAVPAFTGRPPEGLVLAAPALFGPVEEEVMRQAAMTAGFAEASIHVVAEPVAAAAAWLAAPGNDAPAVVVLDCGGGTVDWAFLERRDGRPRLVPECPPDGLEDVGGYDVDLALYDHLRQAADGDVAALEARRADVLAQLALLKHGVGRRHGPFFVRLGAQRLQLAEPEIRATIAERFVARVRAGFSVYLDLVRRIAKDGALPPVLLTGGAARLSGLREAVTEELGVQPLTWEDADFAVALGALMTPCGPDFIPIPTQTLESPVSNGAITEEQKIEFDRQLKKNRRRIPDQRTPTVLLCGRMGVGKTTTLNTLFGMRKSGVGHLRRGTTKPVPVVWEGKTENINIIDMPGLGDIRTFERKFMAMYREYAPKADGYIVFVAAGRPVDWAAEKVIRLLLSAGVPAKKLVFAFNKLSNLHFDRPDGTVEEVKINGLLGPTKPEHVAAITEAKRVFLEDLSGAFRSEWFSDHQIIEFDSRSGWNLHEVFLKVMEALPFETVPRFRRAVGEAKERALKQARLDLAEVEAEKELWRCRAKKLEEEMKKLTPQGASLEAMHVAKISIAGIRNKIADANKKTDDIRIGINNLTKIGLQADEKFMDTIKKGFVERGVVGAMAEGGKWLLKKIGWW